MTYLKKGILTAGLVCAAFLWSNTPSFAQGNDLETVITYENGSEKVQEGILNPTEMTDSQLKAIDSYEIQYKEESILEISVLNDEGEPAGKTKDRKYFSAEFEVSEVENTSCFIGGLTEDNVKMLQDAVIDAFKSGTANMKVEDLAFIDTEKTGENDTVLCWAASASCSLEYTGWLEQAGIASADALLDRITENTADDAGWPIDVYSWFFNDTKRDNAFTRGSGQLVNGYAYNQLVKNYNEPNAVKMSSIVADMKQGYGTAMTIGMEGAEIGHAISLWGFVFDNNYSENSLNHYKAMFVTDSDDDIFAENREYAPNKMCMYELEADGDLLAIPGYHSEYGTYFISKITSLQPYSEDLPKEEDPQAMLDTNQYPNLAVEDISYYTVNSDTDSREVFPEGQEFTAAIDIRNYGKQIEAEEKLEIPYTIKICKESGEEVYKEEDIAVAEEGLGFELSYAKYLSLPALTPGKYTIYVLLNEGKSVREAFYVDNTYEDSFEIVPSDYKISDMKIRASLEDPEADDLTVTFDYEKMEDLFAIPDLRCRIYSSEDDRGIWESIFDSAEEESLLPERCNINKAKKVQFLFLFTSEEMGSISIKTNEVFPKYHKAILENSSKNCEELSYIYVGANSLNDGEKIAVKVADVSTIEAENDVTYTVKFVASSSGYDEETEDFIFKDTTLYEEDVTFSSGVKEREIVLSSWENPILESKSYDIKAVLYQNEEEIDDMYLGNLPVGEAGSPHVTTGELADCFDGETSLREAIEFVQRTHSRVPITFASDVTSIMVDDDMKITGNVVIDASKDHNNPIVLSAEGKEHLFYVKEGASLSITGMMIKDVELVGYGSVFYTKDADLFLKDCTFENCKGYQGTGIYAENGSVKLENVSFTDMYASLGAALFAKGNAKADLLNCTIINGYTNGAGSAIYDSTKEDGYVNLVDSSVLANASIGGGASIHGTERCNIINSIVISSLHPEAKGDIVLSIDGKAHVYGSYVGTVASMVSMDDFSKTGTLSEIAYVEEKSGWEQVSYDRNHDLQILPKNTETVMTGFKAIIEGGKIVLMDASGHRVETGVKAIFSDYGKDIVGHSRDYCYGSYSKVAVPDPKPEPKHVAKKSQTIKVTKTLYKVSRKKLKKKSLKYKIVAKAKTNLTFKKIAGNRYLKVSKDGKLTISKKLRRSTYYVIVKITAKESSTYKAATKKVKIRVRVR